MMIFSGHGVNDVYPSVIEKCMDSKEVPVNRPNASWNLTREIHPCLIELTQPRQRLVTSYGRPVNVAFALAEVLWMLIGSRAVDMLSFYNSTISNYSDDSETFNAAYGYRMREEFGQDQLEDIIRGLTMDPTSRQAVMSIWSPKSDSAYEQIKGEFVKRSGEKSDTYWLERDTKDRACNLVSHALIRDDRLDWLQVMRSNDALWGLPYNWMQWTHIQEYVAWRLGIPVGNYHHLSNSLHIYEHQWAEADAIDAFDIYDYLPEHAPIVFGDGKRIEYITYLERLARHSYGIISEIVSDIGDFWSTALFLWQAHALYRDGRDSAAFEALEQAPDKVYVAAQMRFYWSMRWRRDKHNVDVIHRIWEPEVAAWICGDRL